MKHIYSFFRNNILAGILVTAPFGLTLFILFKLGTWIVGLVSAIPGRVLGGPYADLPKGVYEALLFCTGLLGTLLIVLIVGALARNILGSKLVGLGEAVITRIPLARTIYTATKQVIETVFMGKGIKDIKRVALLEFPRKGMYSIGFITGNLESGTPLNRSERNLVGIFVPTTPNPTTGYYVMLPEEDVKELHISIEDAFRIIMSGGLAANTSENALPGTKNNREV
ncbi:MAG TPA: DUF502 domain-containing protein [Thermodesulfobacteriota bacterium]|nr:DUF502 domain-containing protein [Thermodesulfobacteriota bacterium]